MFELYSRPHVDMITSPNDSCHPTLVKRYKAHDAWVRAIRPPSHGPSEVLQSPPPHSSMLAEPTVVPSTSTKFS